MRDTTVTSVPPGLSDAALLRHAIAQVSYPAKELRSFALHAPLELLARHALLAHVEPSARELVRLQLQAAAEYYQRTTEALPFRRAEGFDPEVHNLTRLAEEIERADMAAAAQTTSALVAGTDANSLSRGLVPTTLDSLAAAGHAPIFFQRLGTLDAVLAADVRSLLVALVPELARTPQLHFSWDPTLDRSPAVPGLERDVDESLSAVVAPEPSPVASIFLLVHQTEAAGAPERALAPALRLDWSQYEVADRLTRLACRIAVRSMVVEPTTHAKYGWSHALTLAHANRALLHQGGDPQRCTRNALLFALAFRHATAEQPLPERLDLPRVGGGMREALESEPATAAAQAYHADPEESDAVWAALATAAAIRNDAHLVKHTLSALEMSREDPQATPIYRAAAAKLVAVWTAEQPTQAIRDTLSRRE